MKFRQLSLIYLMCIFISCNEQDYKELTIDECINNFETLKSKTSIKFIQLIKYWWKDNQDFVVINENLERLLIFRNRNGIYEVIGSSYLNTINKDLLFQELQWIQDTLKVRSFSINRRDSSSMVEFVIDNIDIENLESGLYTITLKAKGDIISIQKFVKE